MLQGEVFDVAVDVRAGSPTFGEHYSIYLNSEKKNQFFIPSGFAHGFCVTSDAALFSYKCTEFYNPANEKSLLWNDPSLNIDWPIDKPLLSSKDEDGICLKDFNEEDLPKYHGN